MDYYIHGGTIWSAIPGQRPGKIDILIEQGKIKALYQSGESGDIPSDVEKIDASGKFLMPGIINAHTHITFDAHTPDPIATMLKDGPFITLIKAINSAGEYIRSGITTIRDLGAMDGIDFALKKAIANGLIEGPRMLVSGKCLCITGGQGHQFGTEVDSPDEARHGARLHIKRGADVVKVMATGGVNTPGVEPGASQLTVEEMQVVVEEAHKAGRRVAAHAHGNQGIKNAIRAGVDTIEHGVFLDEESIQSMLEKGIYLIPTLSASYFALKNGIEAGIPESAMRKNRQVIEIRFKNFRKAYEAGVKIALGTDQGTPLNLHGNVIQEIRLMIENGCTIEDALYNATRIAADALGIGDNVGTLEAGKYADILALNNDPLKSVDSLENISWVMKEGKLISGINS